MDTVTKKDAERHREMLDEAAKKRADAIDAANVAYGKRLIEIEMQYGEDRWEANRWLDSKCTPA